MEEMALKRFVLDTLLPAGLLVDTMFGKVKRPLL